MWQIVATCIIWRSIICIAYSARLVQVLAFAWWLRSTEPLVWVLQQQWYYHSLSLQNAGCIKVFAGIFSSQWSWWWLLLGGGSIPQHTNEITCIFQSIGHLWFASIVQLRTGRIQSLGREGRVIKAVKQTTEQSGGRGRSLVVAPLRWKNVIFFSRLFMLYCLRFTMFFVALIVTEFSKPLRLRLLSTCPDIFRLRHLINNVDRWKKLQATNQLTNHTFRYIYIHLYIYLHHMAKKSYLDSQNWSTNTWKILVRIDRSW